MRRPIAILLVLMVVTVAWQLTASNQVDPSRVVAFDAQLTDVTGGTYTRRVPLPAVTSPALVFVVKAPSGLSEVAPPDYRGYSGELRIEPGDRSFWLLGRGTEGGADGIQCELILELVDVRDEILQLSRQPEVRLELRLSLFSEERLVAASSWIEATQLFRVAAGKLK
ncbi:MAG TPA: hypothetical protein VF384_16130 [Planctomycetota bacterium]